MKNKKQKLSQSPLSDVEHVIAGITEGFFILLIVMVVLFVIQHVFALGI